ncbi:MAG: peptidase S41 [Planctomycetota bacterium]|nr:MAG: peptidase S41 [Planctomycetota bacterium]
MRFDHDRAALAVTPETPTLMPRRNLILILLAAILALVFHAKARQNRYAAPFSEAIDLIKRNYIQEVDDRKLFEAAMNGMASKLDENSGYLSPEKYTSMLQNSIELEFEGIGAHLTMNQPDPDEDRKEMTILMPILDGPADKAGVKAGDVILEIDGQSTAGLTLEEAVDRIKGPIGTQVTLTLRREGMVEPLKISIARAKVVFDSVIGLSRREDGRWNYFVDGEPRIKYLRLTTFATHTAEELGKRIGEFKRDGGIDALVLDLRDNLGGRLDAAVAVCDMFVKQGEIVTIRERQGRVRDRYTASGHNYVGDFPMAVLINGNSASASEITAACLQDHERAIVVGTQSYGKGTVQDLIPLEHGRSRLKLTTATFWRPSGRNIHRIRENENDPRAWGVRPDKGFEVPLTERQELEIVRSQIERSRPKLPKPANGKKAAIPVAPEPDALAVDIDPQLRKAVEYLRSRLK